MNAASAAVAQQVCGRLGSAEPETGTSTSPQQALAHLSFCPARLGTSFAEREEVSLVRIQRTTVAGDFVNGSPEANQTSDVQVCLSPLVRNHCAVCSLPHASTT